MKPTKAVDLISELLGGMPWLNIEGVAIDQQRIEVAAQSVQKQSGCPCCGALSASIHSHYGRTLLDLPWGEYRVHIHLWVRRFRCHEIMCERNIFTERFTTWIERYARRTARVWKVVTNINLETSSRSTSRISDCVHMAASSASVLRKLHTLRVPEGTKATMIGVDDFAFKRSRSYGTIIVDLETNKPVDLLADRTAPTLTSWLKEHPEVKLISRDRSTDYANGISQAGTKATQVLDRWHLLKNLSDALERAVQDQQEAIKSLAKSWGIRPRQRTKSEELARAQHREERQERYQAIRALHKNGLNISQIGRELGFHPSTIRRAIRGDALPERHGRHATSSILTPFMSYLEQRWAQGYRNASQLWRDIKAQGYPGTAKQISRWAQERRELPFKHRKLDPDTIKQLPPAPQPRYTALSLAPRQITWLLQKPEPELTADEVLFLDELLAAVPHLGIARALGQDFQTLFFKRDANQVDVWLAEAQDCTVTALQTFAAGLQRELAPFKAAVTLSWSNGPVEGNINKLKFIKRQMYGRASFSLLRRRVLLAA